MSSQFTHTEVLVQNELSIRTELLVYSPTNILLCNCRCLKK